MLILGKICSIHYFFQTCVSISNVVEVKKNNGGTCRGKQQEGKKCETGELREISSNGMAGEKSLRGEEEFRKKAK